MCGVTGRPTTGTSTRRRVVGGVIGVVLAVGSAACTRDEDPGGPEPTDSTTTTGVAPTSSTVAPPTSVPGGTPGQGGQAEQPGGTAQPNDPDMTNTTQAAEP